MCERRHQSAQARRRYRAPFGHTHKTQEEIYILVSGSARMKIGDDVIDMEPLTAVRVAPETIRSYEGGPTAPS